MEYLKGKNEKSKREIEPYRLYLSSFKEKEFLAVDAYCFLREQEQVFNFDRILKLEKVE